jgi:hypothetical protein
MNTMLKLRSASSIHLNKMREKSMRKALALAAAAASVVTSFSIPTVASAQQWRDDPCRYERHEAARNGTIAGGLIGALVGSSIAGRGNRTTGAIVGGAAGAVAGHQIGAHSVSCTRYPAGYRYHQGCHWMTDTYRGQARSYEVCRGRDGYWRPYDDRDWRDHRDYDRDHRDYDRDRDHDGY